MLNSKKKKKNNDFRYQYPAEVSLVGNIFNKKQYS